MTPANEIVHLARNFQARAAKSGEAAMVYRSSLFGSHGLMAPMALPIVKTHQ
jgi:hypothetical protein